MESDAIRKFKNGKGKKDGTRTRNSFVPYGPRTTKEISRGS